MDNQDSELTLVSRPETKGKVLILVPFVLRDETGQEWTISVRPDGQLQTAKWPDGEPLTMRMRENRAALDSLGKTDSWFEVDLADNA